ncbi:hypothetical protein [Streptomyces mirabilis]|uniref:hypothetical protein n=1 Tax=Streptomyces mirabilis TaxID=68239 RepID=UPI0036BD6F7E
MITIYGWSTRVITGALAFLLAMAASAAVRATESSHGRRGMSTPYTGTSGRS